MDQRHQIADQIMDLFGSLSQVKRTFLRGSLADTTVDDLSDIDIGIDVSGSNDAQFALTVPAQMDAAFDLHSSDWATSLMPEKYVLSFFIKGLPLFWHVDIEVYGTPHFPELTRANVERDSVAGCLKVWVDDTKYLLRGMEGAHEKAEQFYGRVFGESPPPGISSQDLMKTLLDEIYSRADGRFPSVFCSCYEIYGERLKGLTES